MLGFPPMASNGHDRGILGNLEKKEKEKEKEKERGKQKKLRRLNVGLLSEGWTSLHESLSEYFRVQCPKN